MGHGRHRLHSPFTALNSLLLLLKYSKYCTNISHIYLYLCLSALLSTVGCLIDRERSLRAEETRRFSVLEVRARESADDISRARTRADLDILEEK